MEGLFVFRGSSAVNGFFYYDSRKGAERLGYISIKAMLIPYQRVFPLCHRKGLITLLDDIFRLSRAL